tara:strand:- start:62 stop:277 length:216 start_codon:yes stop_codon:yes gene_type:complete
MPIWLRNFTHKQIADFKQKESDAYTKASSKSPNSTSTQMGDTNIPEHIKQALQTNKPPSRTPSYSTKASKK